MKRNLLNILLALLAAFTSTTVWAQEPNLTYFITPYAGYSWFDHEQDVDDAPVYGIRLGYNFTKYFGLEASVGYINTNYDVDDDSRSTNVGNYGVDGIFNLMPDSNLVPFVFVGVGGQHVDYPKGENDRDAATAGYGAGLKYFLTESIALRTDIRQTHVFNDASNLDNRRDIVATLGVAYYFGGPDPAPTPRPAAVTQAPLAQKKAVVEPEVIVLTFEDIHFDFDQSTLKPEAKMLLKKNIQLLKDSPKTQVRIAGYTSASGTDEYNQKLSERRANAVKNYLITEGIITQDRLSIIGYGEINPAKFESTPQDINSNAAKANMRVLFEIIVK